MNTSPVTTGSLIQRSFGIFRVGFLPFCGLAFIFYSPVALLQLAVFGPTDSDLAATLVTGPGLMVMLGHVLLTSIAAAAVVYGVFQGLRGRPATLSQCISVAASRWPAIVSLAILTVLVTGIGYLMCLVPGFILTYGLFIAGPVLIVEKRDPVEAMKRSWELTDGYKMTLFFLALTIIALQLAVSVLLNLAFGTGALSNEPEPAIGLLQVLEGLMIVVFTALNAVAASVAYHDLRSLREGLDDDESIAAFD